MRKIVWVVAGWIGLAAIPALAVDGDSTLNPNAVDASWARWQGRLSLGTRAATLGGPSIYTQLGPGTTKVSSASLMGDYYFSRALVAQGNAGGFRATSGLIVGPRSTPLASGQPTLGAGNAFSIGSRLLGQTAMPYANDTTGDSATLPYLGFGYTGLSARNGWSFSADLGLVAQQPGGLKTIRSQSLDDAVREMRLAPLVQLGVSYAF